MKLSNVIKPFAAAMVAVSLFSGTCLGISAGSAILYDTATDFAIYEKDADHRRLIASTTKIMTALVAMDCASSNDTVTVPKECARVGGSSMYLSAGEEITVRELEYGLLLASGNDAALALAKYCGRGDESLFVELMNDKASQLGLENTSFANPHGLDDENNYSTARDMAKLAKYAMENEEFHTIVSSKVYNSPTRTLSNHNKLLWQIDGACGVKTGYTKAAGRCLVSCAEQHGRRLIAVTLDDPDDWNDHTSLYSAVFDALKEREMIKSGDAAAEVPKADGGSARAIYAENVNLWLTDGEAESAEIKLELPKFVYNYTSGKQAGRAFVYINGAKMAEARLMWA